MEITSKPEELDEIDRKILQLEMEKLSLKKETDSASLERLEKLEKELADLKEQQSALNAQWQAEKEFIARIRAIKEEIERVNVEIQQAERDYNLNRAAELKYGTVARLIGAPPGYVGYDEGGQLTEAIRRRPYAVILFDEIEKAHPDVFNTMLQILDDGRLTDAQGHTVDFKNAVIIMTSNIGSQYILDIAGDDSRYEEMRDRVMDAMGGSFRPEFLNRIDEIIIFHSLTKEQLREIVKLQVQFLERRLEDKKMSLKLSDAALDWLAEVGYDPVYGARPLKRAIQKELETQIAKKILRGELKDGDTIFVDVENERLVFKRLARELVS